MRSGSRLIVLTLLILFAASACVSSGSNEPLEGPTEVAGPALVMFYTDN